ncbi:MAG: sulfotransferase domain-containing protein [Leptolyngbyaceae cyanobacterium MO_188.B28]|nr:sulfotransferase domain-containing protein [Leptolyngbyaceae cyanobacterium MO_188.B28]
MKPDFIFIGASKCATSTISNLIGQHPDVFMISQETWFFSHDEIYQKGRDWYESLYENAGNSKVRGERNNVYSMKEVFPKTVARLAEYNPNLKLIYCVRHPIERIESYWLEIRSHGGEDVHYDFNTAVKANRERLVDASNYWSQINAFRRHFPDDQILILFLEDFKHDADAVMRNCFEFIGVDPDSPLTNSNLHLNPSHSKLIPSNTLSRLRAYPLFRNSVKLIPEQLRNTLKHKLFFKQADGRPQWAPAAYEWALDILGEDTRKFLNHYGKSQDFWQI